MKTRNTMKKICALALAFVMGTSLLGCGGGTAVDENTLVIGGIGPITGPVAVYGTAVMNGAQLAVDEINAAGGINGMQLKLDYQDDEHDTEKAVNAYNTVKDHGAKLLLGTVTSNPCIAVKDYTYADNMFQLTPAGSSVPCCQYDNAFRVCFSNPNQGVASAQYLATLGMKTAAVIYDASDSYSSGIYEKFAQECANVGIEIVVDPSETSFTSASKTDFSAQLTKINSAKADVVFLPIYYQEAALILKQADSAGYDFAFFGCDGLDGLIGQLGDDAELAEGVMLLTPFVADDPAEKVQTFVKAYKEKFNEIPNQFAADGYDGIYIIKAALEKAAVDDPSISISDLCDKMKAAMLEIEVAGVTGTMTWSADGECEKTPNGMVIRNGSYSAITK